MTLAPSKPSTFKRSSERKVIDPYEQIVCERERRHQEELRGYEEVGFSVAAASVLVERHPIHDESRYDVEGLIFP